MKLMIYTQVRENYGTPEAPRWKNKGGIDYVIKNVSIETEEDMARLMKIARKQVEVMGEMYEEWVISCRVEEDDYLTDFEKSQLEYDGRIIYATQELTMGETA